jgi:hypothetical protein
LIILDHNIPEDQVEQLCRWRIRFRQIGFEVGRPEWDDQQEILRYLHQVKRCTSFTRDLVSNKSNVCKKSKDFLMTKRLRVRMSE